MREINWTKLAHISSWILHPFVLPIYVISVILFHKTTSTYSIDAKLYIASIVFLYTIIIPVLSLIALRISGYITSYKIDTRKERILPLIIGAAGYAICAITIAQVPTDTIIYRFMIAAACCELICLVVTFFWKISLHLTGMGAVVALFIVLNILGEGGITIIFAASVLCAGILATARLYLGCHTGTQILVGFCSGFIASAVVLLFS